MQIEKELTAVVFRCEKIHCYVYGKPIDIDSDHKPLVSISRKPLVQASPRLQRLLLRLQKYDVTINYLPGKYMYVADALSRAFLPDGPVPDEINDDVTKMIHSLVENLPMTVEKLEELKSATVEDEFLQQLIQFIKDGWPSSRVNSPSAVGHYWKFQDEIFEANGLLFFGQKLIIPEKLRPDILRRIRESHLGMEKCKSRARAVVYWPGISADIERLVAKCSTCLKHQRSNQKEPLKPHTVPARAWQILGTDIFKYKSKSYLVIVDYYSKFPKISLLKDKSSQAVITSMKSVFARHGIPDEVVADNMPFSSKECLQFAQEWGFKISTSSPHYPQSNGMSERTFQTIKNLLRKAGDEGNDPYIALLEYRNTPSTGMQESPARLLMSRMLKSKLPTTTALLQPKVQENVREKLEQRAEKQKEYFDRNAKPLRPVKMYQSARIRREKVWEPAVITGTHKAPRSFIVTTPQGRVYRRNRRRLLPTSEPPPNNLGPEYDEEIVMPEPRPNNVVDPQPVRRTSNRTVRLPERLRNDYVME
jgi:transposase InsO family protein